MDSREPSDPSLKEWCYLTKETLGQSLPRVGLPQVPRLAEAIKPNLKFIPSLKDLKDLHHREIVYIPVTDVVSIPLLDYDIGLENFDKKLTM